MGAGWTRWFRLSDREIAIRDRERLEQDLLTMGTIHIYDEFVQALAESVNSYLTDPEPTFVMTDTPGVLRPRNKHKLVYTEWRASWGTPSSGT